MPHACRVDTTIVTVQKEDPYAKTNSPDTIISDINEITTLKFDNINENDINGGGFPYWR